jgi:hypothetical protein
MAVTDQQFADLTARVLKLEKAAGFHQEDHTPATPPTTPTDEIQRPGRVVKFGVPSFVFNGAVHISQTVVDDENTELIDQLIANQLDEEDVFHDGILILVAES